MRSNAANGWRLEGGAVKFIPAFLLLVCMAWAGEKADPPLRSCEEIGWQAKAPALQACKSSDGKVGQTLSSAGPAALPISSEPLSVKAKLRFHVDQTVSPGFVVEMAAYAGALHWMDTPSEWGQGAEPYGKRVASAAGATAIRNVFAFALDSTLREDPRYRLAGHGNFFVRIGHAARETFVTRTDGGRTRFATWRFGSALGAACVSNVWYPDRLNTFPSGMEQGAATIGLDLLGNVASEFWPDVKHMVFRRR